MGLIMLDVSENKNACWGLPTKYQNGKLNQVGFLIGFAPKAEREALLKEFSGSIKGWMGNVNLVFFSFLRHKGVTVGTMPSDLVNKLVWATDNDRASMMSALFEIGRFTGKTRGEVADLVGVSLKAEER